MFQQNVSSSSDFTASQGFEQFLNAKGKKEEEKTLDQYLPTSAKVHQSLHTKKQIEKKYNQQIQQMAMQQQYMMGMGQGDPYGGADDGYGGAYDVYDQYMMDDPEMMAAAAQQGMFLDDAEDEKNAYDFEISEQTEKSNQIDESKKKYLQKKQQLANKRKAQQEKEEQEKNEQERKVRAQQQAEEDRKKRQQEFLAKQQQQEKQPQQPKFGQQQSSIQSSIEGSGDFDISEAKMSGNKSSQYDDITESEDFEKSKKKMMGLESSEESVQEDNFINPKDDFQESKPEIYDSSLTDQFKLKGSSFVKESKEFKEKELLQQQQQQQNIYEASMGSDPLTQSEEKELELKRQRNELDFNKLQEQKKFQQQKEDLDKQLKEKEEDDRKRKEEDDIRGKLQKLEQERKDREREKEFKENEFKQKEIREKEAREAELRQQELKEKQKREETGKQSVKFQDDKNSNYLYQRDLFNYQRPSEEQDEGSGKAELYEARRRNELYQKEVDNLIVKLEQAERKVKTIESDYGRKEMELATKLEKAQERVDYFDNVAENRAVQQLQQQMEQEKEDLKFELDKAKDDSEYYRKLSEKWRKELIDLRRIDKGREEKDSIVAQLKRNIVDLQEKLKLVSKRTYMSKLFELEGKEDEPEELEEGYCVEIEKELQLQELMIKGYQKENERIYSQQLDLKNEVNGLSGKMLERTQKVNEMKLELAKSKGKFILEGREVDIRELQSLAGAVLLDENEIKNMEKRVVELQEMVRNKDIRILELEDELKKIREKKKEMEQEFVGIGLDRMHAEDREIEKIEQAYKKQVEGFLLEIDRLKQKVSWYVEKWEEQQEEQKKLIGQLQEKNESKDKKAGNEKYFKKRAKELEDERNALEEALARRRPDEVKQIKQWRVNVED